MWKSVMMLAVVLILPISALAEEDVIGRAALIVEKNTNGTNLREKPNGKVIYTIPMKPKNALGEEDLDLRQVLLLKKQDKWFSVIVAAERKEEKVGWMHQSVLGAKAAATAEGECTMREQPTDASRTMSNKIPVDTVLHLLDANKDGWYYLTSVVKGQSFTGWLPEKCLNTNPWSK